MGSCIKPVKQMAYFIHHDSTGCYFVWVLPNYIINLNPDEKPDKDLFRFNALRYELMGPAL